MAHPFVCAPKVPLFLPVGLALGNWGLSKAPVKATPVPDEGQYAMAPMGGQDKPHRCGLEARTGERTAGS